MSATKVTIRCVECGRKTSTTDPARAAAKACIGCRPTLAPAPAKRKAAKGKTVRAAAPRARVGRNTAPALPAAKPAAPRPAVAPALPPTPDGALPGQRKKVSALDAAAMVLRDSCAAMTPKEIYAAIVERKLWASKKGKTPDLTIGAAMGREIEAGGEDCRFVKAERGKFAASPAVA